MAWEKPKSHFDERRARPGSLHRQHALPASFDTPETGQKSIEGTVSRPRSKPLIHRDIISQ